MPPTPEQLSAMALAFASYNTVASNKFMAAAASDCYTSPCLRGTESEFYSFIIDICKYANVAGGYAKWMIEKDPKHLPKDIDLWPTTEEGYETVVDIIENKYKMRLSLETDVSKTYLVNGAGIVCKCLQVIKYNGSFMMKDLTSLIQRFDFSIVQAGIIADINGYMCCKVGSMTRYDLEEKILRIEFIKNPLVTMRRLEKYIKLGYTPLLESYIKVARASHEQFTSIQKVIADNKGKLDNIAMYKVLLSDDLASV